MIVRVDRDGVDADGGEQRIIGDRSPRCGTAAAIGRFPNAAADSSDIGDVGRHRIDRDVVNPALGLLVIKAAGTSDHVQRLGAERSEAVRAKCYRRIIVSRLQA